MKKLKQLFLQLPEYYLVILALLSGYTPHYSLHPIAIGFAVLLSLQIIFNNRISGLIIAGLFFIGNLYMLFAGLSELNEFNTFNWNAQQLLIGLTLLLAFHLLLCWVMFYKYIRNENTPLHQPETSAVKS